MISHRKSSLTITSTSSHHGYAFNRSIFKSISPFKVVFWTNVLLHCFFSSACGFVHYTAKPLDPAANAVKFAEKDTTSKAFEDYLINNGYQAKQLPITLWGLNELTYSALFFNPSLDVARAQWRVAQSAVTFAAAKPIPTLNSHIANSNRANGDISPFAFGLSIDIPIETASKRDMRIENAVHLSQIAKLEIAEVAWQLRHQVSQTLNEYQFNQRIFQLLNEEQSRRQEIVSIYQKRLTLGAASNVELSTAKLQLQNTVLELNTAKQNIAVLLAKLASILGLSVSKVEAMHIATLENSNSNGLGLNLANQLSDKDLQASTLLNRLDIRIALEKYAAAETQLKLEIAKQYPDISISPGYAYEFGDRIWSLGLSSLLTLLNKNKGAIAQATALREVEAAQFMALQNKVISEANVANAQVEQAKLALDNQQVLLKLQQANSQRMSSQYSAGEIDRLAFTFVKLEDNAAEKNLALSYSQLITALNNLENSMQRPLQSRNLGFKLDALDGINNEP